MRKLNSLPVDPRIKTVIDNIAAPNLIEQRDDAAATIENVYSLLAMIGRDIPPGKRFAELWAAIELIDAWRERAREARRDGD